MVSDRWSVPPLLLCTHMGSRSTSEGTPRKKHAPFPLTPVSRHTSHSWPMTPSTGSSQRESVPPTPSTSSTHATPTPPSLSWRTPSAMRLGTPSSLSRSVSQAEGTYAGLERSGPSRASSPDFTDGGYNVEGPLPSLYPMLVDAHEQYVVRGRAPSSSSAAPSVASTSRALSRAASVTSFSFQPSRSPSLEPRPTRPRTPPQPIDPAEIDLTNAPSGPSGWPLRYVCDMATGFRLMRHLEDHEHMKRIPAFEAAFHKPYKRATFHQNMAAWEAAGNVRGEHDRWVAHGREREGEWSRFYQRWKKRA